MMHGWYIRTLLIVVVCAIVAGAGWWWHERSAPATSATTYKTSQEQQNVYVRFDMEAYDDLEANYWQSATDSQLAPLFFSSRLKRRLAHRARAACDFDAQCGRRNARYSFHWACHFEPRTARTPDLECCSLQSFAPIARDNLLSSQAQTQLANTVNNVNPNNNLYNDLGLQSGASSTAVAQAVAQKTAELSATTSAAGLARTGAGPASGCDTRESDRKNYLRSNWRAGHGLHACDKFAHALYRHQLCGTVDDRGIHRRDR